MDENEIEVNEEELIRQIVEDAEQNDEDYMHLEVVIPKMEESEKGMISSPITIISGNTNPFLVYSLVHTLRNIEKNLLDKHPEVALKMMLDELRDNGPEIREHKRREKHD